MIHLTQSLKLLFALGSRGEWGYIKPIIDEATSRGHDCQIVAMNMAILPRYGDLATTISENGYTVSGRVFSAYEGDLHATMAKSVFSAGGGIVDLLSQLTPDWMILAGDRAEQLGAAIAGAFTYTPTAHIQAGEVSGNIDDTARHAIARFAHIHFASNSDAAMRLKKSGEEAWRVLTTGAPQLDHLPFATGDGRDTLERLAIPTDDFCLAIFHPVTESRGQLETQTRELLSALNSVGRYCVWILPNNDAGGHGIRELIESQSRVGNSIFVNLERNDFLMLMQQSAYLVGNSSAGLLEAPSYGIPAVNVGRRQLGRVRGVNVIDVEPTSDAIVKGIQTALDPSFRTSCKEATNPYGDGKASPRIVDALESTARDDRLLIKRLSI